MCEKSSWIACLCISLQHIDCYSIPINSFSSVLLFLKLNFSLLSISLTNLSIDWFPFWGLKNFFASSGYVWNFISVLILLSDDTLRYLLLFSSSEVYVGYVDRNRILLKLTISVILSFSLVLLLPYILSFNWCWQYRYMELNIFSLKPVWIKKMS